MDFAGAPMPCTNVAGWELTMNRFVDILNRIRQHANTDWLTPSQRTAYELLRERLEFLDEINLWGPPGVGKTFIGWVLHAQQLATYAPRLEDVEPAHLSRIILVDNLSWQRSAVRCTLHNCREQGYEKVVLISAEPVHEQIAGVELRLTTVDIGKVAENLRAVGVAPRNDAPQSLWNMVSPLPLND
jgi:hypothetical protein